MSIDATTETDTTIQSTTDRIEEVRRVVADLYDSFATGDATPWASRLSSGHTPTGIGTDPHEFWSGRDKLSAVVQAQVREMNAVGISLESGSPVVDVQGGVAWVADQPTLRTGDGNAVRLRLTVVLTDEDGTWHMSHFHLSTGVPNERLVDTSLTV
jgi:ketosteroid isomerase-like protein